MSDSELLEVVRAALATVNDPEIHRPITDLGMVDKLEVDAEGTVSLTILLTIPGCPLRNTIEYEVQQALRKVPGVHAVQLQMAAMDETQRADLAAKLRGQRPQPIIEFAQPGNLTRVISVASGKGGVGKSSITINLALALAKRGRRVGLLDADIYGHSVPDLLGLTEDDRPNVIDKMIMPVPVVRELPDGSQIILRVISMGMLKESRDQVIAWRGPILDRALTQLLSEVFWGDLDYFLIDLPPGTGDVALSLGQKLPDSELIVVTTPQPSVAVVSERAGTMGQMMGQNVIGVVENMSWFEIACQRCGEPNRVELFGSGGGQQTADALTDRLGREVPLLARVPMEVAMGAGSERHDPIVLTQPGSPAASAIAGLAERLDVTRPSLAGKPLHLSPR